MCRDQCREKTLIACTLWDKTLYFFAPLLQRTISSRRKIRGGVSHGKTRKIAPLSDQLLSNQVVAKAHARASVQGGPSGRGQPFVDIKTKVPSLCTVLVLRMAHRIWKQTKQQPGTAGPGNMLGCCSVSFHFLLAIPSTSTVLDSFARSDSSHANSRGGEAVTKRE